MGFLLEKTIKGIMLQNGVAKYMNRIFDECTRCMRLKLDYEKCFG